MKQHLSGNFKASPGFTLIELIMVMVILSILGVMGTNFITQAFKGFAKTDARMEIYEEGKLAMLRMEREIRNAVPNAVSVSNGSKTLSIGVIDENALGNIFGQYTQIDPSGTNIIKDLSAGLPLNTLVSIYNTDWGKFDNGNRVYQVTNNTINPITLDTNISSSSPNQRFFPVKNKAVSYEIDLAGTLSRLTGDVDTNGVGAFGNAKTLAKGLSQTGALPYFNYIAGTSTKNGVVAIHFTITKKNETLSFHKEIHVSNVP